MSKWLSQKKKTAVSKKTNGRCGYCGVYRGNDLTVDHVTPSSQGGNNALENLVLACRSCNSSKGNRSIEEYRVWVRWRGMCAQQKFSVSQIQWMLTHTDLLERYGKHNPEIKFYFERIVEVAL